MNQSINVKYARNCWNSAFCQKCCFHMFHTRYVEISEYYFLLNHWYVLKFITFYKQD